MSRQQHSKLDAIVRFLQAGEERFLRRLADYANQHGAGAFPRRKTLIAETGFSGSWLRRLEDRLVARGWVRRKVIGAGCARRTVYRLQLPAPSAFEWRSPRPSERSSRQLLLPFEPVEMQLKSCGRPVDADPIEWDLQIPFASGDPISSDCKRRRLLDRRDSDPKNLDPKEKRTEEGPTLARRLPPRYSSVDLERLRFASRNLKARLERDRQRVAALRKGRR